MSSALEQQTASVDQVAAANVASTVASTLELSIDYNVQNLATSLNIKNELSQTDASLITKPQIVQLDSGRSGISTYVAQQGDSVQSVASKFTVSDDTIRWSNNLTSDSITAGKELRVPGVTGVIYSVRAGDSVDSLASKYQSDASRITTYNNLELSGLIVGSEIVIPSGILPENERPGYVAPTTSYSSTSSVSYSRVGSYAGNGYAYGYCTWYAYNRRAELGRPIGGNWGNAVTWAYYARVDGFAVDKNPRAGDVFQIGGGLGHVGVVERVNADGSIYVSEMNYVGWNIISNRTIPASVVASYNFIH